MPRADAALLLKLGAKREDTASRLPAKLFKRRPSPWQGGAQSRRHPSSRTSAKREGLASRPQVALCKHRTRYPKPTQQILLTSGETIWHGESPPSRAPQVPPEPLARLCPKPTQPFFLNKRRKEKARRAAPQSRSAPPEHFLLFELAAKREDMASRPQVAICTHRPSPWLGGAQSRRRTYS